MEQCSRQCLRRTLYAVMVGVSPIVICLIFIGLARCILYRLEIAYYRRQKVIDRRSSLISYQSGRLALSYTPVSNAELQRIIQGEYQNQQASGSSSFSYNYNNTTHKAPRFIKSILTRREPALSSSRILANLVIRRDAIDASTLAGPLTPMEAPLQPTFSILNEQGKRRPSVITIRRESVETTTLAPMNNNHGTNGNSSNLDSLTEREQITHDPVLTATKRMTTTTTVVMEEFLDYETADSLPGALTLFNTIAEDDDDSVSEINKDNEEEEEEEK